MSNTFKSNFTFGGAVAEKDQFLMQAYWDNGDYAAIEDKNDYRCFLIGRTGSGKTALFKRLEEQNPGKVIRIIPENLSLPYLTNLGIINDLQRLGVHLEPFFRALWKHVIVVEILRHRYGINSPEEKNRVFHALRELFLRDATKTRALEYLNEFGDKFWCETEERIHQIAENFVKKIGSTAGFELSGTKASVNVEGTESQEDKYEVKSRYQRIVNDTQLPRLNEMIIILNNEILKSSQNFTYIVVDDLDKEWVEGDIANILIRCLFDAVIDLQGIDNLKILVALRTNIFQQLDYGKLIKGGQEEKVRNLSLNIKWTENDLRSLLNARAAAASQYYKLVPPKTLNEMLPISRSNRDPVKFILDRTLLRPRDAISYLNACVREATGKDRMTFDDITKAEKSYSEERLAALRDEWKDPYYDIDKVFELFRSKPSKMNQADFTETLDEIALLVADVKFKGTVWLTPLCEAYWATADTKRPWNEIYGDLVSFLYTITFIGISKTADGTAIYSWSDATLTRRLDTIKSTTYFEIHPSFRQALNTSMYGNRK